MTGKTEKQICRGEFLETEYGGYGMGDICIPYPLRCEAY